jgi:hypothetical protein
VPDVVRSWLQFGERDVADEPLDLVCECSHALFAHVDSGLGNIQHGDVLVSPRQEIIGQRGFAPANVDDGGRRPCSGSFDKRKRRFEMGPGTN